MHDLDRVQHGVNIATCQISSARADEPVQVQYLGICRDFLHDWCPGLVLLFTSIINDPYTCYMRCADRHKRNTEMDVPL